VLSISDFDGLYSGQHNDEIQLYAFDILALDGDDLRKLPLHLRKTNLARLLAVLTASTLRHSSRARSGLSFPRRLRHDAGGTCLKAP
jgi:ATP-dependent DNA ligase